MDTECCHQVTSQCAAQEPSRLACHKRLAQYTSGDSLNGQPHAALGRLVSVAPEVVAANTRPIDC